MTNKQANSIGLRTMLVVVIIIMLLVVCSCNPQETPNIIVVDCNHSDSLSTYNSFNDVPAGADNIIIIDGILYQKDSNKIEWTPIYLDEYVMWIARDGDTIWE